MTPTPAIYLQSDEMMPYLNSTASAIAAGTVIVLSTGRIGIAGRQIPAGALGALYLEGIFRITKAAGAVTLGQDLYWDDTNKVATTDSDSGVNMWLGTAVAAQAAADATVDVILGEDRVPQQSVSGVTDAATIIAALKKAGILSQS